MNNSNNQIVNTHETRSSLFGFAGLLGRGIDTLSFAAATFGGLLLIVMSVFTNYEIFSRYLFNSPTSWSLEFCVYILLWFSFIGLSYIQRMGRHIRVDLLLTQFDQKTRALWNIVGQLFGILFISIFTYFSFLFFQEALVTGEVSADMTESPMWIPKLSLFAGAFFLILQLIRDIILEIYTIIGQTEDLPHKLSPRSFFMIAVYLTFVGVAWGLMTITPFGGMIVLMLILLFGGVPIYAALGLVGMAGIGTLYGGFANLNIIPNISYGALNSFGLASLPLFILAGQILANSGVGKELYELCSKWLSNVPGGLAGATIFACAIFAAISLSSVATAATIGIIALPELARHNYNKRFSYGTLAAGGTLGLMIPPSGTMIIYSAVTEESLGQLFMAGLIPGFMIVGILFLYSTIYCRRTGHYDRLGSVAWGERIAALKVGAWGLGAPVIILVGIYSGIFTPLEAGGVVVLYALIVAFARKKMNLTGLVQALRDACVSGGMILIIIAGALILGTFMTLLQIPTQAIDFINSLHMPGWAVIAALMALYFVLGMFLEVVSAMLITLPVVYPLIISLGYDGIWFAVLITINMEIAVMTPPVGLNLYVIKGIADAPLKEVLYGTIPFFFLMLLALILIAVFPGLSTWLPSTMFG